MFKILAKFLFYLTTVYALPECGKPSANSIDYYIIGGEDAKPLSWPWMAQLDIVIRNSQTNRSILTVCDGTIINEDWILTAAHCFEINKTLEKIDKIIAKLGKHYTSVKDENELYLGVTRYYVHPSYLNKNYVVLNDIALLKLNRSLDFFKDHKHLQPICLPLYTNDSNYRVNETNCWATGWGRIKENGPTPYILQQVSLPILDNDYCKKYNSNFYSDGMLCTANGEGKGVGDGDSGGPLVCQNKDGIWIQKGIISFSLFKCDYYTNVLNYIDWISKTILPKPL